MLGSSLSLRVSSPSSSLPLSLYSYSWKKLSLLRTIISIQVMMRAAVFSLQRSTTTTITTSTYRVAHHQQQQRYLLYRDRCLTKSKPTPPSSFALRRLSSSTRTSLDSSPSSSTSTSYSNHLLDLLVEAETEIDATEDGTTTATLSSLQEEQQQQQFQNSFFALRHGQSLANVAGIIASNPDIACSNYGLSDVGKEQAAIAGKKLLHKYLNAQMQTQKTLPLPPIIDTNSTIQNSTNSSSSSSSSSLS